MDEKFYPISVCLILIEDGQILLQKRKNTGYADGLYGLSTGKIHPPNESATQGLIREAKEELGIHLEASWLEFTSAIHGKSHGREGIALFFKISRYEGIIQNKEPDKCDHLKFFHLETLPKELIPYMRCGIENTLNGVSFAEYGW